VEANVLKLVSVLARNSLDLTIDEGRSGALELKQREAGMLSDQRFYGKRGADWEEEYRQLEMERKRKREIYREIHGEEMPEEM